MPQIFDHLTDFEQNFCSWVDERQVSKLQPLFETNPLNRADLMTIIQQLRLEMVQAIFKVRHFLPEVVEVEAFDNLLSAVVDLKLDCPAIVGEIFQWHDRHPEWKMVPNCKNLLDPILGRIEISSVRAVFLQQMKQMIFFC